MTAMIEAWPACSYSSWPPDGGSDYRNEGSPLSDGQLRTNSLLGLRPVLHIKEHTQGHRNCVWLLLVAKVGGMWRLPLLGQEHRHRQNQPLQQLSCCNVGVQLASSANRGSNHALVEWCLLGCKGGGMWRHPHASDK